jgi:hypothetical protein
MGGWLAKEVEGTSWRYFRYCVCVMSRYCVCVMSYLFFKFAEVARLAKNTTCCKLARFVHTFIQIEIRCNIWVVLYGKHVLSRKHVCHEISVLLTIAAKVECRTTDVAVCVASLRPNGRVAVLSRVNPADIIISLFLQTHLILMTVTLDTGIAQSVWRRATGCAAGVRFPPKARDFSLLNV